MEHTPFTHIIKRDGRKVPFDAQKITIAIRKAGEVTGEFGETEARRLMGRVLFAAQHVFEGRAPGVEEIQDLVEESLLQSPYKRTAKAFILYRDQHARSREIADKAGVDLMDQYLERSDWQVRENSNMSYSLQGLNNHVASEISKVYWSNKIYPSEIRDAHKGGDFHLHDLGILSVYCVGWDLYDLLGSGFRGAAGKVESAPAKHFRTALGQAVNFFYTLQGEAAGAQAFSNFDTLLAPFIRHDGLNYKEVKQALQEFLFNVNVPTRVGFQTPFTNVTLDVDVPSTLADQAVIIGGKLQDTTYSEFQHEMDMFNKAFLEVMCEGDAKGRVFTFPIPTYNIGKDFDWEDPRHEPLWQATAKYGIPYFANFVNSDMNPEDARSMCCRLRIDNRQIQRRLGGLFGSAPLTGSIGVVTMNLPRLGYLASDKADFMKRLGVLMDLAKESLEIKRKVLERFTEAGLYPYMKYYLRGIRERMGCYWANHFSTIGLVGMNEACVNLLGEGIATDRGHAFAVEVVEAMKARLAAFSEETKHPYNLEATPAEGTSHRLARMDKAKYPDILCANETSVAQGGAPFYTNSTQLPVDATDDPFELLARQDDLQSRYTGGTVQHLFMGERVKDTVALREFVKSACASFRLPYFSITPTFSVCPDHGYQDGEKHACPTCGTSCEVYSRVVGYIRPVSQWNDGKQEEYKIRKTATL